MTDLTLRNGAPASRFVFGTMQWGGTAGPEDARATWEAARAAGITHFDTAHAYTGGASETMLGALVAETDRDGLYIATKAAYVGGSGRDNLIQSLDESLKRLKMEAVDLLYLHRWDANTPLEETFETLAGFQAEGRIRQIGVSNFAAWQVMKAQVVAAQFGTRIDVLQPMLNLVKRQVEVELLPMAADQGITVCAYSPLGGGLLTGKYAAGQEGRLTTDKSYATRYGQAYMAAAAADLARVAEREGTDPATLAVAWVARHAPDVRPILSGRTAAQLAPSIAGMTYALSDTLYEEITALAPTPPPATDRLEEA